MYYTPTEDQLSQLPKAPLNQTILLERHRRRLAMAEKLRQTYEQLGDEKSRSAAAKMLCQLVDQGTLSYKQWLYLKSLHDQLHAQVELPGDFAAILVMFRLATANGQLKRPKVRFATAEPTAPGFKYFELWFFPEEGFAKIMLGGWQGSGRRHFGGWVKDNKLIPYRDRLEPEMIDLLRQFVADPLRCAKAMSQLLSACMYCGQRLSDAESKAKGYGPVCAENYELPWGKRTVEKIQASKILERMLNGEQPTLPRTEGLAVPGRKIAGTYKAITTHKQIHDLP